MLRAWIHGDPVLTAKKNSLRWRLRRVGWLPPAPKRPKCNLPTFEELFAKAGLAWPGPALEAAPTLEAADSSCPDRAAGGAG
jgi:hypothetical protein